MKILLTVSLFVSIGMTSSGPPRTAIHALNDGTFVEAEARKSSEGYILVTPFGRRTVPTNMYKGPSSQSVASLASQYKEMRKGVRRRHRQEHEAIARWCLNRGYLTGLRKQLNHLLSLEIDDPWARRVVADLARTYVVDRTEKPKKRRDRRKFVDYLFETLARKDNVGAVMAIEKAFALDKDLTYRPAMKALRRGNARTRWAGARLLAIHTGEPTRISPLYKQSLKDGIWAVRREAVRSLKVTGDEVFVRLFAKHLSSPKAMLRVRAAQALAELGMEGAIRPLINALQDTWRPVRNYVAITNQIAYVKDYDVEVAQTAFIADPVVDVIQEGAVLEVAVIHVNIERRIYRDALRRLTGANLGTKSKEWRRWLAGRGNIPAK